MPPYLYREVHLDCWTNEHNWRPEQARVAHPAGSAPTEPESQGIVACLAIVFAMTVGKPLDVLNCRRGRTSEKENGGLARPAGRLSNLSTAQPVDTTFCSTVLAHVGDGRL